MEDDFELFDKILKHHGLLAGENQSCCAQSCCKHLVLVDGACVECHQHFQDGANFSEGRVQRRLGHSLAPDLANKGFSDDVVSTAQAYFRETQTCSPAFRGKMRLAVVAASVYHAMLKAGTHAPFAIITRMFAVDKHSASRGFQRVKMSVAETRNQFETPSGVAAWIAEQLIADAEARIRIVSLVGTRFSRVRLCPSSLRASVAAAFVLLSNMSEIAVAECADAPAKKVASLVRAFRRS